MDYRKLVHELFCIQEIRKSTIKSLQPARFLEPDDQHSVRGRLLEMSMLSKDHRCCGCGSIVAVLATVISKPAAANRQAGTAPARDLDVAATLRLDANGSQQERRKMRQIRRFVARTHR